MILIIEEVKLLNIYVILASWNDVLYKLETWSKSYYLSKVYYDQFSKKNPDAIFLHYHCDSVFDLYNKLKEDMSVDVQDIIDSNLKLKSSYDKKMYAIYKEKYSKSFDEFLVDVNKDNIMSVLAGLSLSTVPLTPYLLDNYKPIMEILFSIYSISKLNKTVNIDPVYIWHFILKVIKSNSYIIEIDNKIPYGTVFTQVSEY